MTMVARFFEDVGGFYVCVEDPDFLDARGITCEPKAEALRLAYRAGYTHAVGSGTYREGVASIRGMVRLGRWDEELHAIEIARMAELEAQEVTE